MIVRNWRDVKPYIVHGTGVDWRLLHLKDKPLYFELEKDRPKTESIEESYFCLEAISFFSVAHLEPGKSYESHSHDDHEEVYYIISGEGEIKIDDEVAPIRDGDVIYIPVGAVHQIRNKGSKTIEFIAFGGQLK